MCNVAAAASDADADDVAMETCEVDESDLPDHLQIGSQLTFSITVLQASGLPTDCTDVFCQFKSVIFTPTRNKNSSGDEIANVNFCTTTTYM